MKNSFLVIFDEIWPKSLYYIVHGLWPDFRATLKSTRKELSTMPKSYGKPCHVYYIVCTCTKCLLHF